MPPKRAGCSYQETDWRHHMKPVESLWISSSIQQGESNCVYSLFHTLSAFRCLWFRSHCRPTFSVGKPEWLYTYVWLICRGSGIAQWLERRTRDWNVAGSTPCRSGGRISSSSPGSTFCADWFRYPFHPRVTAAACNLKIPVILPKVQVAGYS